MWTNAESLPHNKSRKRTPERMRKGGGGLLDGDDDAAIVLAEDIGLDRV